MPRWVPLGVNLPVQRTAGTLDRQEDRAAPTSACSGIQAYILGRMREPPAFLILPPHISISVSCDAHVRSIMADVLSHRRLSSVGSLGVSEALRRQS